MYNISSISQKIIKLVFGVVLVALASYTFYDFNQDKLSLLYNKYFPCRTPIAYHIEVFDPRFGISKEEFLRAAREAEDIWEGPTGIDLFSYTEDSESSLGVNLIYDYRQEATIKILDLGEVVEQTRASYDALKAKYFFLNTEYLKEKEELQARLVLFTKRQSTYNQKVKSWNDKGGAPPKIYEELNTEAVTLNAEFKAIRNTENKLNQKVADINSLVSVINQLGHKLNLNVEEFNTIGQARGEEFTEGEYKADSMGGEINIYEFSTMAKLRRILAHEFGHALGLGHVEDPEAIMYRLNEGEEERLTEDDLTAMKSYCQIK